MTDFLVHLLVTIILYLTLTLFKYTVLKPSKPVHVGNGWIALAEYSQLSTRVLGFQSFSGVFLHQMFWSN